MIDLRRTHELEEAPNVFAGSSEITCLHQNMIGDEPLSGTQRIATVMKVEKRGRCEANERRL